MKRLSLVAWMMLAAFLCTSVTVADEASVDLKRGVPPDAYLAIYAKHNPERDYQRKYWQDIFTAIEDSEIVQRAIKLVASRIPGEELDQAKSVIDQLKTAVEPINLKELVNAEEAVYAQKMEAMSSQHLVLMRMPPETAANYAKGIVNLFRLVEQTSDGAVPTEVDEESPADLTIMALPPQVPFRPAVAHHKGIFLFSSSADLLRQSLSGLMNPDRESKFDDPRLRAALETLPAAEDAIVFYDGKQQFQQMRQMVQNVGQQAGDEPEAKRWLGVVDKVFDEVSVMDYEITVEYTDDNLNRTAVAGKLLPEAEGRLLDNAFGSGEQFEQWYRWVPEDATRYSLTTGVNLHAVYEFAVDFAKENIPESQLVLERFESWQDDVDLHIDEDILQAFSGECVSVSVPSDVPSMLSSEHSITAMRCEDPEGVRKLLHRLVDQLQQIPAIEMQQLRLSESEDLEGFEEVSATIFAAFGARPVIGFRDGWMICGTNADVVQKVLDTRAGNRPNVESSETFKQFQMEIEGPVQSVSYANMARSTRQVAAMLKQAGVFLPMIIGLAGAEVDAEDLEPIQEFVGLLPSVGQIVGKFDFLEAKLSVTQRGDEPGSYTRRSVILVRPPGEEPAAEPSSEEVSVR